MTTGRTNTKKGAIKPKGNAVSAAQGAGLGLEGLGDLSGLLHDHQAPAGVLELALDVIEEDPQQPRHADNPGFSLESIAGLGATIKLRGVKSPISVRENPEQPGRYIINHGARRYRGSKWAGKTTIKAFVDNDYNHADQVVENLQRDDLTPREIADYIGRELAAGKKKNQIAEELGKSAAWVTQYSTLLELPDPVADAFVSGRATDVTVINELVTAYKKNPVEVGGWLANGGQELTRGAVKMLRDFLEEKRQDDGGRDPNTVDALSGKTDAEAEEQGRIGEPLATQEKPTDPMKMKKAIVMVEHTGRLARLVTCRRPAGEGSGWIRYADDGEEIEVTLSKVTLIAVIEG